MEPRDRAAVWFAGMLQRKLWHKSPDEVVNKSTLLLHFFINSF